MIQDEEYIFVAGCNPAHSKEGDRVGKTGQESCFVDIYETLNSPNPLRRFLNSIVL